MSLKLLPVPRAWTKPSTTLSRCNVYTSRQQPWISIRFKSDSNSLRSNIARSFRSQHICGIWYNPDSSATGQESIISQLPRLTEEQQQGLSKAVFLVSPNLAHWFDKGSTFLHDAMNRIYTTGRRDLLPTSHFAVVDGLPAPECFDTWSLVDSRPCPPAEGIAVCFVSDVISPDVESEGSSGPSYLRIISRSNREPKGSADVLPSGTYMTSLTIPFANTLFVNGARNTAAKATWKATSDGKSLEPKHDNRHVQFIQFRLPKLAREMFNHNVPLHALTVRRKVLSSMGNVVREVEGDDGKPLKASMELEAQVPKFLAQQSLDGEEAEIQVYARVMPPDAKDELRTVVSGDADRSNAISDDLESFKSIEHEATQSTLWHLGQMYRVTGGGGGWGKKAGLLSLDPATDFNPPLLSEQSMFPDPDALEGDTNDPAEIGSLVPAGHTIQFWAARVKQPRPSSVRTDADQVLSLSEVLTKDQDTKFIFGNTSANDATFPHTSKNEDGRNAARFLPGSFGALSEAGTSLALVRRDLADESKRELHLRFRWITVNQFRIDAPTAMFRSQFTKHKRVPRKDKTVSAPENGKSPIDYTRKGPRIRRQKAADKARKASLEPEMRFRIRKV